MSVKDNIAIKVTHVSKSFKLPHEKQDSLKGRLIHLRKRGFEIQQALKDISFEVKKGEFFGIVGRNGSGKSTLLKMLAGIYMPNSGEITIDGKLTPFIELGVGFNPELSGRDNVFLNGALLGFTRDEMEAMYDDIVEFAELEKFMDQKLKNYSSGMQVRLAFSIAIRADTDILILDEVLAVGDAAFQQKCFDYFATLKYRKKTVILVSHSMSAVERFCDRAILIESGRIVKEGSSKEVASAYEKLFIDDINQNHETRDVNKLKKQVSSFRLSATTIQDSKVKRGIEAFKPFELRLVITAEIEVERLNIGVNIRSADGVVVFSDNLRRTVEEIHITPDKEVVVTLSLENYFTNGKYFVDVVLVDEANIGEKVLYAEDEAASFDIMGVRYHAHSLFHTPHIFTVKEV